MSGRILTKCIFRIIHPSWQILAFTIGIIVNCIFVQILRPQIFSSPLWIILAIILLLFSILISRGWMIALAILSSFLIISARAGPDFSAQNYLRELSGKTITLTGKIAKDPTESDTSDSKINLDLISLQLSDDEKILPGHVFAQIDKIDVQRSDVITLQGKISDSFGSYYATMFRPEVVNISRPESGDIFLSLRNTFSSGIKNHIPSPEAGLGIGFLLGQKSGVDSKVQDALQAVGLTHIIVASGAHLSVLIGASRRIFGKLSRFSSLLAALLLMLIFLGITGLSASMLRASLVTTISLTLWYFGRKIHPARLIVLVAAITLIYNPFYLTDLSWLLSFSAFSGIMILAPLLIKAFYGQKKPGFISSTLITSIATTLTCTPILLFFFGQISLISVLANILILPTVSIAMGLTFFTGIFSFFLPAIADFVGFLARTIIHYQIEVANFFASSRYFLIQTEKNNPLVFLLYIPVIVVFFTTLTWISLRKGYQNKQTLHPLRL